MTYLIRSLWHVSLHRCLHPVIWSLVHMTDHMIFLQNSASVCIKGGDAACTVNLPILAHSSFSCWWYFLANFMNSHAPVLLSNLSHFWLMWGLILTTRISANWHFCLGHMLQKIKMWLKKIFPRSPDLTASDYQMTNAKFLTWLDLNVTPADSLWTTSY